MAIKEEKLDIISRQLNTLIKLMAYQTVGKMKLSEAAPLLRRLGYAYSEIAAIYGTTTGTVSVRLAEAKKKSRKERR